MPFLNNARFSMVPFKAVSRSSMKCMDMKVDNYLKLWFLHKGIESLPQNQNY